MRISLRKTIVKEVILLIVLIICILLVHGYVWLVGFRSGVLTLLAVIILLRITEDIQWD